MTAKKSDTVQNIRDRADDTYANAREKAVEAYDSAKERAADARDATLAGIDRNPLIALGGGLAIGALLAALLPKTRTEDKYMGKTGAKITGTAKGAYEAAKTAGREKLADLNISKEAGTTAVETLFRGLGDAARSGGQAAKDSVQDRK